MPEILLTCTRDFTCVTIIIIVYLQTFQNRNYPEKSCLMTLLVIKMFCIFFRGDIKYCFNLNKDRFVLTQQFSENNSLSIGNQRGIYLK